ncbi:MAG: hypothetical protein HRU36_03200 [Rickettsiales bacterium]|nr:hypothetical protein [Rickettsiales bacterium]
MLYLFILISFISISIYSIADSITNVTELYFGEALLPVTQRSITVNPNIGQSLYKGSAQIKTTPVRGKLDITCSNTGTATIDIVAINPTSGNLMLSDFTFYFSGIGDNIIPPIDIEVRANVTKTIYFGAKVTYNQNIGSGKHNMHANFNLTCP